MKLSIREGVYRMGVGVVDTGRGKETGVVIVFPKIIMDVSGIIARKYCNEDVSTQWIAYVNKVDKKMDKVVLQIDWVNLNEHIIIPFSPRLFFVRDFLKKIGQDKRIYLVNSDNLNEATGRGFGGGVWAEISRVQILDWMAMEDKGKDIYEEWNEPDAKKI